MNKVMDLKVNIKPVMPFLVHSGIYEGPCRVGDESSLDPRNERIRAEKNFRNFYDSVKSKLKENGELMDPVVLEWSEDWIIPEKELEKLDKDSSNVDLFLIFPSGLPQYPSAEIARRYGRPIAMVGQVSNIDIVAYLRSKGMEGYAPIDLDDLNYLIFLLRVRKWLHHTRFLIVSAGNIIPVGTLSSIRDLEDLKARFGIDYKCIPWQELFSEMDRIAKSSSGQRLAENITDKLIKNADKVHMKREYILPSVYFYLAVKNLMKKYSCNAFTTPCFELCVKRVPAERKVTFCLAHSLLKDEGYPSSCEGDINVLLAMTILMYISGKSAYMGNSYLLDKDKNIIAVHHDVPGLKMKGFNKPDLPYEIRNFTVGGWGATIRYDFSRDKGETVTLARFNPTATKLFVARGEIVGCGGFDKVGCSLRAEIKVSDAVKLFHEEAEFGHHLAMVYGDYVNMLKDLGKIIGFNVIEV